MLIGINSHNANFHAYNNNFANIYQLDRSPIVGTGSGIHAASDFDANDRTVVVGDGTNVGANNFDDRTMGVYVYGQQNDTIYNNNFGYTTGLTYALVLAETNDKRSIKINDNHFYNFLIGTYICGIGAETFTEINGNHFTDANVSNTDPDFYGTAINIALIFNADLVYPHALFQTYLRFLYNS